MRFLDSSFATFSLEELNQSDGLFAERWPGSAPLVTQLANGNIKI